MTRIAVIAVAVAGFATPALAADPSSRASYVVPVFDDPPPGSSFAVPAAGPAYPPGAYAKAPPVAAAVFSWTGCHIGGHIGVVVSDDSNTGTSGRTTSYSSGGIVGGGQIGCDYQFARGWVAGVEGRAAGLALKNTHAATVINLATGIVIPSQITLNNDFLGSATARLGYNVSNLWLVYVRGGGAWTHEKIDDAFTNVRGVAVDPNAALTRSGWTAGAGVEWAFKPCWSAALEYNYYDFGSANVRLVDSANRETVSGISVRDTIHAFTASVNYHF
jgi:outer membrane immunogenic protein